MTSGPGRTIELMRGALAIWRETGDAVGTAQGLYYLVEDVRPAEAVRRLGYSLALRERLGDPRRIPGGLVALGEAGLAEAALASTRS
jgi:hypothetical protein